MEDSVHVLVGPCGLGPQNAKDRRTSPKSSVNVYTWIYLVVLFLEVGALTLEETACPQFTQRTTTRTILRKIDAFILYLLRGSMFSYLTSLEILRRNCRDCLEDVSHANPFLLLLLLLLIRSHAPIWP